MAIDIRDKPHISHQDILDLNFIKAQETYVFRKYYKQGLRSQVIEVLEADAVFKQARGEIIDGLRLFPWAQPVKILRIFRTKFNSLDAIFEEIKTYKLLEKYLPPDSYSKSCEFVVDYFRGKERDIVLCGLQDYVAGEVFNPWELIHSNYVTNLIRSMQAEGQNPLNLTPASLVQRVRRQAARLVSGLKAMVADSGYIPDLAGVGNLILTAAGCITLVDINNICEISFACDIPLDDKGYPVCDRSIKALALIEQKVLRRTLDPQDKLYRVFLDPERMAKADDLEGRFFSALKENRLPADKDRRD